MTEGIENQADPGAANSPEPTPAPSTLVAPPAPKVEISKDGIVTMEVGGKMVKMVKESDLMAAKQSLEGKLETQQQTHNQAVDALNLKLSAEQQNVAKLNAELEQARNASGQGATDNVARITQERDEALSKVENLTTQVGKSLELKRALMVAQFPGLDATKLEGKTMQELDSLEEALKTVATNKGGGLGAYATGASLGSAQPLSDYDRRKAALAGAQVGTREAPPK